MSIINNPLLLGAPSGGGGGGYQISRSVRLNQQDSAHFSRAFTTTGNRTKWTWAGWVKRSNHATTGASGYLALFGWQSGLQGNSGILGYNGSDRLVFLQGGSEYRITVANFRDIGGWAHITFVWDSNNPVDSQRCRIYVNGLECEYQLITPIPLGTQLDANTNSVMHGIGADYTNSGSRDFFPGYLADIHFIDNQALTPSSFGAFDENGVWQPKAYTGTYGTTGFYLNFADNSSNTATTLGKDTSGNGNNWTPRQLFVNEGLNNDSFVDFPTNGSEVDTGLGGEVRGNYCTLNELNTYNINISLKDGGLAYTQSTAGGLSIATFGVTTGKWYWEHVMTGSYTVIGAYQSGVLSMQYLGGYGVSFGFQNSSGHMVSGVPQPTGTLSPFGAGDVIGFALDMDAGTCVTYKNGVQMQTFSGLTGRWFPATGSNSTASGYFNFGQRRFAHPAPSGFKALCSTNLPTPTIPNGSTAMDVRLWTGDGTTSRYIGNLAFSPDLVWIKNRSSSNAHNLVDTVRGASRVLSTSSRGGEPANNERGAINSFSSDGFTVNPGTVDAAEVNSSGLTYVGWCWDAGSTTVTNTNGSILSQVRANPSAGFSIVSWDNNSSGQAFTVGHGLGVEPQFVVHKPRNNSSWWFTWHVGIPGTSYLDLNSTAAPTSNSTVFSGSPTSTVLQLGSGNTSGNYGVPQIAYCWAPVEGYSAFGTYQSNNNANGTFVYTGFRPRWVLIKLLDAFDGGWVVYDSARNGYNTHNKYLFANVSSAEGSASSLYADILSNGFKLRGTDAYINGSDFNYIYVAFAEHPFAISRAR